MSNKFQASLKIPSTKKSKGTKMKILKMLANNLSIFKPEYVDHFLCPTCLDVIPIKREMEITEAHIIPKSAGGKLKTYLCDRCNHSFGTNQDKWFGEYIKSINDGIPKLISSDIKDGCFWIDGIKLNGAYKENENGELNFIIYNERNSPETLKIIKEKFKSKLPSYKLSISPTILKKTRFIEIGFLTAGYLMWFATLGYSWVLQDHLNIVRDQIRNPDKNILGSQFIMFCEGIRWKKPWIGLVTLDDEVLLTMGLEDCMVLFPPADRPDIYFKLEKHPPQKLRANFKTIQFSPKPFYGPCVSVMLDNRILVYPNAEHNFKSSITILFESESLEGHVLYPIGKEEMEELKKRNNVKGIRSEFSPLIKKWNVKERSVIIKK